MTCPMAGQPVFVVFITCLMFHEFVAEHCGTSSYSIYQMMLKGHTYTRIKARPGSPLGCKQVCDSDVRCQSYNYIISQDICELNTRTKEARPDDFIKNSDRYYFKKTPHRGRNIQTATHVYLKPLARVTKEDVDNRISHSMWNNWNIQRKAFSLSVVLFSECVPANKKTRIVEQ